IRVAIDDLAPNERHYLVESHLISAEMEKGGAGRLVFFSPDIRMSLLVNEEDHLRLQCFRAGFRLHEVLDALNELDGELDASLDFAFHEQFGYLTACPTNVGTGLRVSVMLHLPALVMTNTVEEIIQYVPQSGFTVRGFYGENSEFLGDFFQISNEVTLGKTEDRICMELEKLVLQVIEKEQGARASLFDEKRIKIEDTVWRAYGTLTNSRMLSSRDALQLLSRLRLGIEQGFFAKLTHAQLNRLMIEVQPAHLQIAGRAALDEEARDVARAALLRQKLSGICESQN
ncbi:MAG: ATP--guanido phosphotransferase, partial [Candidatus Sumerlaeota bacterium]|nr:ATP--guanido phosphotransferase [Candidatus Sumerlaeota bacterium]